MKRLSLAADIVFVVLLAGSSAAMAAGGGGSDGGSPDPPPDDGGGGGTEVSLPSGAVQVSAGFRSELTVVTEGQRGSGGGGPAIGCSWFRIVDPPLIVITFDYAAALVLYESLGENPARPVGILCFYAESQSVIDGYPRVWTPNPPVGAEPPLIDIIELEEWTSKQLPFAPPAPELSPAGDQVVGVVSWLAVTSQITYDSISARAEPIWVTATPVFRDVTWDMGNGDTVVCTEDVDLVWTRDAAETRCRYVYTTNGPGQAVEMPITATVTWEIYVVNSDAPNAAPRFFGTVTQDATVLTNVRELQAVID